MRLLLYILLLLPSMSNAQFTSAVWSGAMVSTKEETPIYPYQQEVLDYQDSLYSNGVADTSTGINALNYLVWALKGNDSKTPYNFWDSMVAVYPFHSGTAYGHSINIRDITGVKVEWMGSPTHDANGVTGNGSSAFGRTWITYPLTNERALGLLVGVFEVRDNNFPGLSTDVGSIGVSNTPTQVVEIKAAGSQTSPPPTVSVISNGPSPAFTINPIPIGSPGVQYGQNDNRFHDSLRLWASKGVYEARTHTRLTGNATSIRQYGVVGRITNNGGTVSFPYPTLTHTCSAINYGALTIQQGHWLVKIFDNYNFLLRNIKP